MLSIPLFSNCLKEKNKFMSNLVGRLRIMQMPLICAMAIIKTEKKVEEHKRKLWRSK